MHTQIIRYSLFVVALILAVIQYHFKNKMEDFPRADSKAEENYLKILPAVLFLMALFLFFSRTADAMPLTLWKELTLLSSLWMIAYVDFRLHLIWNEYILMCLGLRGILFLVELVVSPSVAFLRLLSELIGSLILLVLGLLLRLMSRGGVGMGDIKLCAVMPLFLGALSALQAMFYSMLVIFAQACFCLITKRKDRKDVLPFAPAILAGTCIYMIISRL